MGNCCVVPTGVVQKKRGKQNRITPIGIEKLGKLVVLDDPTGHDIEERYTLGRELGRGEYGVTYFCTDKSSGEILACKKISKNRLRTPVDVEDVRREVKIMRKMPKHPNIVSLKGVYEDDNAVHLVMELCEGGELFDRIVSRGHYTEKAASVIFRTIVEVVQACHQNGVMHRDLKPENFLFTNGKETASLKAIDFGLSVTFTPGQKFNEIVGSPYYMAPEILKKNYGHEVDIWSAGVILYILLCGSPPFWAVTEHGIAKAVLKPSIDFNKDPWPRVSDTAKDLIKKMLDPNPTQRLTVEQVLDHPWLQNMNIDPNGCLSETVKGRLKRLYAKNKLKQRALRVIGEYLSKADIDRIKERFALMDTKKRGKINIHELRNGLYKLGHKVSYKDLQFLMEVGDADKDGHLDDKEFVAVAVHLEKMGNDDHLRKTFAFFDQNKSGFIEREEMRISLADELDNNGEEVIDAIFQDVDTDKDGRISYDEFASMMRAGTDRRKASRHYSRERFNSLDFKLIKDGSLLKASEL